jgi:hypothetical protein
MVLSAGVPALGRGFGLPASGRGVDGPAHGFGSVADVPVDAVVPGEGLASGTTGVLAGGSVVTAGGGVVS